jgi:hypothetical protein
MSWTVTCTAVGVQSIRMLNSLPIREDHSTSHKATHTTLMQTYYYLILMVMLTRTVRIYLMTLLMDLLGLMHSLKAITYIYIYIYSLIFNILSVKLCVGLQCAF